MPPFIMYVIKLSVCLAAVMLFYRVFLYRLTFYNWNRFYLVGYTVLAFLIPLMDISPVLERQHLQTASMVNWVPLVNDFSSFENETSHIATSFTAWNLISLLLVAGAVVMLARLLVQVFSFRKLLKRATYMPVTGMKVFHLDEQIIPFSFGDSIFINQHLHSQSELEDIIRHEFVHVKQAHSIDIIWGEILCLLNWYNPFAWMLKKAIRQNLEFIADNKVLENGIVKTEYQYLLLKVMGNNQYSIANQFNFSSLKKRIAMMNKLKTAKVHLVKFLFILPMIAIMLVSFRKQAGSNQQDRVYAGNGKATDTVPAKKNMPANVESIQIDNNKATVTLKDGTRENYDLAEESQQTIFEEKYGNAITPPPAPPVPPVPPVAPVPPAPPVAPIPPLPPVPPVPGVPPVPPVPPVAPIGKDARPVVYVNGSGTTVIAAMAPRADEMPIIVENYGYMISGAEDVLITITKKTSKSQLDDFIKQMRAKDIKLHFENVNYNDGVLTEISGYMESKDGRSNFVANDFSKLVLSMVKKDGRTYLKVSVKDNSMSV